MENQHGREDRQRRKQVDVVAILHLRRCVPDEAERPLKDHNRAGDEADDERRVVFANEMHDAPAMPPDLTYTAAGALCARRRIATGGDRHGGVSARAGYMRASSAIAV